MISPGRLSVILCAHNPRTDHLRQTLAALHAQRLPLADWELLLVDNASAEPLAARFPLDWHPHARHLVEPRLGLTPARLAGIAAATADVLVFVDDDNLLAPDYLTHVLTIAREFPFLGAWGGCVSARFEQEPPDWARPYLPLLAVRDIKCDQWSNRTDNLDTVPCGAGLCARRAVAERYRTTAGKSPLRLALGRTGASLSSGEDTDLALTACDLGLGTGVFARLQLMHLIPAGRLDPGYLTKLAEGIMRSYVLVMSLRQPVSRPQPSRAGRLFSAYRRMRLPAHVRAMEDALERGRQAAYDLLGL